MERKHRSSKSVKLEREINGIWSRWVRAVLKSCELWSSHVKGKPLREVATGNGQTRILNDELWSSHVKGKPLMEMATVNGQTRILNDKLWSSHVKGKPLREVATGIDQTRRLNGEDKAVQEVTTHSEIEAAYGNKCKLVKVNKAKRGISGWKQGNDDFDHLVGRLKYLWSEINVLRLSKSDLRVIQERLEKDVIFSFLVNGIDVLVQQVCGVYEKNKKPALRSGGTSCKKRKLRKLSKMWIMMRKSWRKGRLVGYLGNNVDMKMIKEAMHQI